MTMRQILLIGAVSVSLAGIFTWKNYNRKNSVHFGEWKQTLPAKKNAQWIPFTWAGDSMGGKWNDKAAILLPVKLEDLPEQFYSQFDVGSNITMLYGNSVKPFLGKYQPLAEKFDSAIIKKDTFAFFRDLHLQLGDVQFYSPQVYVQRNYGDVIAANASAGTGGQLGTIGADVCKDNVLIIDYPSQQLCIAGEVPSVLHVNYTEMSLDADGRPLLKMNYHGKTYHILFDCGSSTFPLIASPKLLQEMQTSDVMDTISVTAWEKRWPFTGRRLSDSLQLAGQSFKNVTVYSGNGAFSGVPENCDGVTGNVLFLDKIIVLDFRNKKFGIAER